MPAIVNFEADAIKQKPGALVKVNIFQFDHDGLNLIHMEKGPVAGKLEKGPPIYYVGGPFLLVGLLMLLPARKCFYLGQRQRFLGILLLAPRA